MASVTVGEIFAFSSTASSSLSTPVTQEAASPKYGIVTVKSVAAKSPAPPNGRSGNAGNNHRFEVGGEAETATEAVLGLGGNDPPGRSRLWALTSTTWVPPSKSSAAAAVAPTVRIWGCEPDVSGLSVAELPQQRNLRVLLLLDLPLDHLHRLCGGFSGP